MQIFSLYHKIFLVLALLLFPSWSNSKVITMQDLHQVRTAAPGNGLPPQLFALNGQTIAIKGFLVVNVAGEWYLSSQPHLRSCCVGKSAEQVTQLRLDAAFPPYKANSLTLVKGVFTCNTSDVSTQPPTFYLSHTREEPPAIEQFNLFTLTTAATALGVILLSFYLWRQRQKHQEINQQEI